MSRVHYYEGSVDAVEPGQRHVFGMVFNQYTFQFTRIPLACFKPHDQDRLRKAGARIKLRACPRSLKATIIKMDEVPTTP